MEVNLNSIEHIIESLAEGLYFTDTNRTITYWNKSAERITGFKSKDVVGSKCSENILVHVDKNGKSLCCGMCPLAFTMEDGVPREQEVYLHHKDGHRIPVSVRVNTLVDKEGNIVGGVELFTDLSTDEANRKRIVKLEKLALVDKLTNLVNRSFLDKELDIAYKNFKELKVNFGVIFIDIDHFKNINDSYGHLNGDKILQMVAKTITGACRPFDIFGRWGGEEFLGVIPNINAKDLYDISERIRVLVENSFIYIDEEKVSVTISLGAAIIKEKESVHQLIDRTDAYLYKSKKTGRNRVTIKNRP